MEWYSKAAEQSYAKAQFPLGWMYENGKGVDENISTAVHCYRKAAEQGYECAYRYLGILTNIRRSKQNNI